MMPASVCDSLRELVEATAATGDVEALERLYQELSVVLTGVLERCSEMRLKRLENTSQGEIQWN